LAAWTGALTGQKVSIDLSASEQICSVGTARRIRRQKATILLVGIGEREDLHEASA
jgi:hypothetical protein